MGTMHGKLTSQKQDRLRAGLGPGTRGEGIPPGGLRSQSEETAESCQGWAESGTPGTAGLGKEGVG